jgi:glycosyltransferase involved in cell wall biosynthesis
MAHIVMTLIGNIEYDGRVRKEIATLRDADHSVELFVSDFSGQQAGGEGLQIPIHFIPMKLRRTAAGNFAEQLLFNLRAYRKIRKIAPDYIHCHDLTALLAGALAHSPGKNVLIFDAHELLPESMGGAKRKIWGFIEKFCVRRTDIALLPERNRLEYFSKKYPFLKDLRLLENFPRRQDLPARKSDALREKFGIPADKTIVLHTGAIAPARHVDDIVDAIARCDGSIVAVILGLSFKGYAETVQSKINELELNDRVFLHGPVPHSEMLNVMAACDVGTALYRNDNVNNYYCASNKLYECIALGKAVVTNDYPGLQNVVADNRLGICLARVDADSLADAFQRAADETELALGSRAYYWEDQAAALTGIYRAPAGADS